VYATEDGQAFGWGANKLGELGNGMQPMDSLVPVQVQLLSNVTDVSAGQSISCFIDSGAVMCTGNNIQGQIGDSLGLTRYQPIEAVGMTDGWSIVRCSRGGHVCALSGTGGGVKCWGHALEGQLGTGTDFAMDQPSPVSVQGYGAGIDSSLDIAVGDFHTCLLNSNSEVVCTGKNDVGQLGDGTYTSRFVFSFL
jgi:alpha-tubulin suppressor-like RCC1 family protein